MYNGSCYSRQYWKNIKKKYDTVHSLVVGRIPFIPMEITIYKINKVIGWPIGVGKLVSYPRVTGLIPD